MKYVPAYSVIGICSPQQPITCPSAIGGAGVTLSSLSGAILVTSGFPTCFDNQDAINARTACMAIYK